MGEVALFCLFQNLNNFTGGVKIMSIYMAEFLGTMIMIWLGDGVVAA